ncbi:MAG: cell division protein FtsQ [Dictyoglomaceae bacterium]|nr:cell division protein FtsQ [Dictyoglomaceae bacterium]
MKTKVIMTLLFLTIISMGFILRIKIEPFDKELFSLIKEKYYKKYYIFCNFLNFNKDLKKKGILIKKMGFYPWTLYFSWEQEYTLIYLRNGNKEVFVNQKGEIMPNYKPNNKTIKVNNFSEKSVEEIIKLANSLLKNIDLKEIILNQRYFEIKTLFGSVLITYENIEEKLKNLKYILEFTFGKKYFIDMRFKIPVIKG